MFPTSVTVMMSATVAPPSAEWAPPPERRPGRLAHWQEITEEVKLQAVTTCDSWQYSHVTTIIRWKVSYQSFSCSASGGLSTCRHKRVKTDGNLITAQIRMLNFSSVELLDEEDAGENTSMSESGDSSTALKYHFPFLWSKCNDFNSPAGGASMKSSRWCHGL